jgi:DNA repair protein RadC
VRVEAFPTGSGLLAASNEAFEHLGMKPVQARRMQAAARLNNFISLRETKRLGWRIQRPSDIPGFLKAHATRLQQEVMLALLLDSRQTIIDVLEISRGSLAQVDVHPRELFADAIAFRAHSIILVHNHPSGDPAPSDADYELTRRMAQAGKLVGVPVLDHLVVTNEDGRSIASSRPDLFN